MDPKDIYIRTKINKGYCLFIPQQFSGVPFYTIGNLNNESFVDITILFDSFYFVHFIKCECRRLSPSSKIDIS